MSEMLELYRSVPRYVAARAVGKRAPGLLSGPLAPIRLVNRSDPKIPGEGWGTIRPLLSGICGSDLALLAGKSSFYFSPLVSMPFVPGHEVVAEVVDEDIGDLKVGTRVVLDPVLSCAARGLEPCEACASGQTGRCTGVTQGHLSAGLQTGYCGDTGGGWAGRMIAHRSQLHAVPDGVADETAVLIEPLATAIHTALRGEVQTGDQVVIVGAGAIGTLTLVALRAFAKPERITVVAKHPRQRETMLRLGADEVVSSNSEAVSALRRSTHALRLKPERGSAFLLGGADVAFDCAGSRSSLDLALRTARAGGRVVLSGIPTEGVDLTPVWFRELEVVGAYTSGVERPVGRQKTGRHSFDHAMELAKTAPLGGLVGAKYPLLSWREALDHAMSAGRLGTVKVAFDPTGG
jgi:threonine dehydrogenase-like Zn-dependent dehydrogenase